MITLEPGMLRCSCIDLAYPWIAFLLEGTDDDRYHCVIYEWSGFAWRFTCKIEQHWALLLPREEIIT